MIQEITEARLQADALKWFRRRYPKLGPLYFMIKNDGKKNPIARARDVSLGLTSGIPDTFLAVPSKSKAGLFIEFKTRDGVISPDQILQMDRLESKGYKCRVIRSINQFKDEISEYLDD